MATAVIMPRQGQSVESCILVEWTVSPNDTVNEGDTLASYETDKASFEIESPASGTILELFFEEGDDIPVLTNIAAIGDAGEDASDLRPDGAGGASAESADSAADSPPTPAAAPAAPDPAPVAAAAPVAGGNGAVGVSPRARNEATRRGITTDGIAGTGPAGRIIERDVVAAAATQPRLTPAAQAAAAATGLSAPAVGSGPGGMVRAADLTAAPAAAVAAVPTEARIDQEIPVKGVRKIIAQRMMQSLHSTAQLTLTRTFDATAIKAFRAKVKANGEAMGLPNITLNDIITFCAVRTLTKFPELNAHFLGDRIVQYGSINVGMAVDTPRGLMVPVLHNADQMTLAQLSSTLKPIALSCREGSVNPDLLTGGTFTITNLGGFGIDVFTPVLNAPEVAILGIGGINLKPVQRGSEIAHIPAMTLSLTIDHQAADGAPGARYLQDLAKALENFELMMAL
jgi:pyruvate dehydrogenase E2 component (dihydrolipoamide acetyltransferase)